VRVADIQLRRVGGTELCTDLAQPLASERGSGGSDESAVRSDGEAVDLGRIVTGTDEPVAGGVEQYVTNP